MKKMNPLDFQTKTEPICVKFDDLTTLITVLSASTLRNTLFPSTVDTGPDNSVYAFLHPELATHLCSLSSATDWRVTTAERPPSAKPCFLADLLAPKLARFDENRRVNQTGAYADSYLLGAATLKDAQEILQILTAAELPGISARWSCDQQGAAADARFYWSVPSFPPLAATQKASGMWYGPVAISHRECRIFVEHPYELVGDISWLRAIDWGAERAAILLSSEPPRQITIDLAKTKPFLQDLIQVANIELAGGSQRTLGIDPPAVPQFSVKLKLSGSPDRRSPREIIDAMQQDLDSRKLTLRRLMRQHVGEEDQPWTCTYEPLFVYFEQHGKLPEELQRLLVECCDQEVLDSLLYTTVEAGAFDQFGANRDDIVHVLMPRSVLGRPARDGTHLWLRDYAPRHGRTFHLQDQWSAHGLRLLLPETDTRLQLYPDFVPGPTAARKIAEALTPRGSTAANFLYLLVNIPAGGLAALALKTSTLRPFIDACRWSCSSVMTLPLSQSANADTAKCLSESIDGVMDQALSSATVDIFAVNVQRREADLRELSELEQSGLALHDAIATMRRILDEALNDISKLQQNASKGKMGRRGIQKLIQQLTSLDARLAGLESVGLQIREVSKPPEG